MVMESLRGFESRVQYNMVGHSGDGPEFPLVEMGKPPVNAKERLRVLQKMRAHASTCDTGDCTLEAATAADDPMSALRDVAAGAPSFLPVWAELAERSLDAGDPIAAYAFALSLSLSLLLLPWVLECLQHRLVVRMMIATTSRPACARAELHLRKDDINERVETRVK